VLDRLLRKLMPFDDQALLPRVNRQVRDQLRDSPSLEEALRYLLGAWDREASLTPIGHLIAWNDLKRLLVNRANLAADRKRWPSITTQPVARPIFITGLPRTGTTLLHGLMASDPRLQAPLTWEVMDPSPPPGISDKNQLHKRIAGARRQLRWFDRLAPGFQAVHEVGAELPQECIAITAHSLRSLRFLVTYRLPSYAEYLVQTDMYEVYREHRQFLQQLQFGRETRRWVLKAPAHLVNLEALAEVYPDALVIQTHRDPLSTLPSLASLRVAARSAFASRVDPAEVGREVADYWAYALERSAAFRETSQLQVLDVDYNDLVQQPLATLEGVYRHAQLPWSDSDAERARDYLSRNPQGKHGQHHYRAKDFSLSLEGLSETFHAYRERMGWLGNRAPSPGINKNGENE